jgi:hypothetical protein
MTDVVRELIAEGWDITAEHLARLSPYITEHQPVRYPRGLLMLSLGRCPGAGSPTR